MAKEKGFYNDAGFDVDFKSYKYGINVLDEVLENRATYAIGSSDLLVEISNGAKIKLLASIFQSSPLVLLTTPKSGINTIEDFVGKKIMITPDVLNSISFISMLKKHNISFDDLIIQKHTFNVNDLINEKTDLLQSYISNEPYQLEKKGIKPIIFNPKDYGFDFYSDILFTSSDHNVNNMDMINFRNASLKGWIYAFNNIDETINIMLKKYNNQNKTFDELKYEALSLKKLALINDIPLGDITVEKLKRMYDLYNLLNLVNKNIKLENYLLKEKFIENLTLEERKYLNEHKTFVVSNEFDYPPYDFMKNNEPSGYSIDLLKLLSEKLDIDIKFRSASWEVLLKEFCENKIDILHPVDTSLEVSKCGNFSQAIIKDTTQFIIRNDFKKVSKIEDLYGFKLASPKGWKQTEFFKENYQGLITVIESENTKDAINLVRKGIADFAMDYGNVARYIISTNNFNGLRIEGVFSKDEEYDNLYIATNKNNEILLNIINKGLNSLTIKDLSELRKKWFESSSNDYKNKILLTNEEKEYLNKKGKLKLCVDTDWMPLESIDDNGDFIGISADLISKMTQRSDLKFDILTTNSWSKTYEKAKNRECDLFSSSLQTSQRKELFNFTSEYINFPFVIATNKKEIYIDKVDDILDKKIALAKGYAITEIMKERYPNKKFIEVDNTQEGLELINKNKIFAYIGNLASVAFYIKDKNYFNIKISGTLDDRFTLSFATRNDEPILNDIMQKAVNVLNKEDKQEAYNKWFSIIYEDTFDYTKLYKYSIPILLLIFVSLYWNSKLYREKKKTKKALDSLYLVQEKLKEKNMELERISVTDKLTNLYNRRKVDEVLSNEIQRCRRTNNHLGVLLLDIDHFKSINDNYGHDIGDEVLIKFANILQNNIRQTDILGRWGGEEFIIICIDTNINSLEIFAQKLRKAVEDQNFDHVGKKTISIGATIYKDSDTEDSIIKRADNALYLAKNNGRNRVETII